MGGDESGGLQGIGGLSGVEQVQLLLRVGRKERETNRKFHERVRARKGLGRPRGLRLLDRKDGNAVLKKRSDALGLSEAALMKCARRSAGVFWKNSNAWFLTAISFFSGWPGSSEPIRPTARTSPLGFSSLNSATSSHPMAAKPVEMSSESWIP